MKFTFIIVKNWIYIIPSIEFTINELVYGRPNFSIQLHWLCFHMRWRWLT